MVDSGANIDKFASLEELILGYLKSTPRRVENQQLHDQLEACGLFELISSGVTRILVEKTPDKLQRQTLVDYMLLKNWDSEETACLEEEWGELGVELQALKEEHTVLKKEWNDILNPPPPPDPAAQGMSPTLANGSDAKGKADKKGKGKSKDKKGDKEKKDGAEKGKSKSKSKEKKPKK